MVCRWPSRTRGADEHGDGGREGAGEEPDEPAVADARGHQLRAQAIAASRALFAPAAAAAGSGGAASIRSTSATSRYPHLGADAMNVGSLGSSPSARRSSITRWVSASSLTNSCAHTVSRSSWRRTTPGARRTSSTKSSNVLGGSGTTVPARSISRASTSSVRSPTRYTSRPVRFRSCRFFGQNSAARVHFPANKGLFDGITFSGCRRDVAPTLPNLHLGVRPSSGRALGRSRAWVANGPAE